MVSELHVEPDRIVRLMARRGKIPLDVLRRQLREAAAAGTLRRISAEQFVANMMGLLIFPFAIRLGARASCSRSTTPAGARFLEDRRRILPELHPCRTAAMIRALLLARRSRSPRSGPSAAAQDTLARRAAAGGGPAERPPRRPTRAARAGHRPPSRRDRVGPAAPADGQRAGVPSERRDRARVRRSPAWPSPTCPRTAGRRRSTSSSGSTTGRDVARRRELEEARHAESEAGVDVALYQLRSDVNSAFYSAFLFEKRVAEYEALVGDLEARLAAVRARVEAGTALGRDAAEIEAERVRAELQRDEARASRRAALATLADLVGHPIDTSSVLVLPDDEPERAVLGPRGRGGASPATRVRAVPALPAPAGQGDRVRRHGKPAPDLRLRAGRSRAARAMTSSEPPSDAFWQARHQGRVAALDLALRGPDGGRRTGCSSRSSPPRSRRWAASWPGTW